MSILHYYHRNLAPGENVSMCLQFLVSKRMENANFAILEIIVESFMPNERVKLSTTYAILQCIQQVRSLTNFPLFQLFFSKLLSKLYYKSKLVFYASRVRLITLYASSLRFFRIHRPSGGEYGKPQTTGLKKRY